MRLGWARAIGLLCMAHVAMPAVASEVADKTRAQDGAAAQPERSLRTAAFFTDGAWPKGQGRPAQWPTEPPWLPDWLQQLREVVATPEASARSGHPLLKKAPRMLTVSRVPLAAPAHAEPLGWADVLCPRLTARAAAAVSLSGTLLDEDEGGALTVGIEWLCRHNGAMLRGVRLVAHIDTRGQVQQVDGVRLEAHLAPAFAQADGGAVAWPLRGADVGASRMVWRLAHGVGWVAQLAWNGVAVPADDGQLIASSGLAHDDTAADTTLQRVLIWLDGDGLPRTVLLQGGVVLGRQLVQPLPRETLDDLELSGVPGIHLQLRVAVLGRDGATRHSGVLAWQLGEGRAIPWTVPLPPHDVEGMWRCALEADARSLGCHFVAGGHVAAAMADVQLVADPLLQRWVVAAEARR